MLHYTFTLHRYINIHMFSYHSGRRKHISTNAQVAKFNFRNPTEKFLSPGNVLSLRVHSTVLEIYSYQK